jgi:hypothetical protein
MSWLELRKGNADRGQGWNFGESVWAPVRKANGGSWPFWSLLNDVSRGDTVYHLRNLNGEKSFVGYSIAASNGYITDNRPSSTSHEWNYSQNFYRVDLTNFQRLNPIIPLLDFFTTHDSFLRMIFQQKKENKRQRRRLFFVPQNGRLQCLNGAYFSEFNFDLTNLLLENIEYAIGVNSATAETYNLLKQRVGHEEFAKNVKNNYNFECCFPNCEIRGRGFLVSSHIARWADNIDLRGHTGNGLCLCLLHDRAFESGFFTIDENFRIRVVEANLKDHQWIHSALKKAENFQIGRRKIDPLIESIHHHWNRVGYKMA